MKTDVFSRGPNAKIWEHCVSWKYNARDETLTGPSFFFVRKNGEGRDFWFTKPVMSKDGQTLRLVHPATESTVVISSSCKMCWSISNLYEIDIVPIEANGEFSGSEFISLSIFSPNCFSIK